MGRKNLTNMQRYKHIFTVFKATQHCHNEVRYGGLRSTFFSIVLCTDDDGIDAVYRRLEYRVPVRVDRSVARCGRRRRDVQLPW
jgi:hypothetical protein